MTQNLYLGSSLNPALGATTGEEFVAAVAEIYGTMVFTDFPTRAEAIADTIEEHEPDLIGLQEVSNWIARGYVPGAAPPSYDFLGILQDALVERGLDYDVAAVSDNADIGPAPLVAPAFGCAAPPPAFVCDVSLQDRDVILVNADTSGLSWSNPQDGRFPPSRLSSSRGCPRRTPSAAAGPRSTASIRVRSSRSSTPTSRSRTSTTFRRPRPASSSPARHVARP